MFEWDETKRQRNLSKHGVDFGRAALVFANPTLEAPDEREDYGEDRVIALGHVGSEYFVVVYTMRGDCRRLISAWKAGRYDKERYQDLFPE